MVGSFSKILKAAVISVAANLSIVNATIPTVEELRDPILDIKKMAKKKKQNSSVDNSNLNSIKERLYKELNKVK